jgi:hypothetical protein
MSRSRGISRPLGAVYGDARALGEGAHLLGVPFGPPAAARVVPAVLRETNAPRRNGAMRGRANVPLGSVCLIALFAPVKDGAAESDAMSTCSSPSSTLASPLRARVCTALRACPPLLRAGLWPPRSYEFKRKQVVSRSKL